MDSSFTSKAIVAVRYDNAPEELSTMTQVNCFIVLFCFSLFVLHTIQKLDIFIKT